MPGMRSGLNVTNSTLVAAFKAALLHQGLIILAILAVLALAWIIAREWLPAGRRLLRIGFGIIRILDGILQAQPAMPVGLPANVIKPAAASSPDWVQHA